MEQESGRNTCEIVLYQPDNTIRLDVMLENETVWLTLNQMAYLFNRDKSVISRHISNIYQEEELVKHSTVANFATVQIEGGREIERVIEYFNLDVIISVGYRVKSKQGVKFRQWASRVLKDYLLRGYVINQRIAALENFAIKTERRLTISEHELANLKLHIEAVLADINDINEDTRIQLELANQSLAELQVGNRLKERNPIGFRM